MQDSASRHAFFSDRICAVGGLEPKVSDMKTLGSLGKCSYYMEVKAVLSPYAYSHPPRLCNFVAQAQESILSPMLHKFVIEFLISVELSFNVGGLLSLRMLKLLKLTDACTRSRPCHSWRSQRRHISLRALGYLWRKQLMAGDYPPAHLSNPWHLDRVLKSTQLANAKHQTSSCLLCKSKTVELKRSGVRMN